MIELNELCQMAWLFLINKQIQHKLFLNAKIVNVCVIKKMTKNENVAKKFLIFPCEDLHLLIGILFFTLCINTQSSANAKIH